MVAISSSSSEGWREPSGPEKVPAPQGDPINNVISTGRRHGSVTEEILTTVNLSEVGELSERMGVTEGDVENPVVGEGGERGNRGRLLSSSRSSGGDEDTGVLPSELPGRPEAAGGVPEGLEYAIRLISNALTVAGLIDIPSIGWGSCRNEWGYR